MTIDTEPTSLDEVATAIRKALYGRSPMVRAQAEARLVTWGLTPEPRSLVLAARRELARSTFPTTEAD